MNSLGFCSFFSEMVVLIPSSFMKREAQRETKYYQIALTCKHIRLFAFSVFSLGWLLAVHPFRRNPSHKSTITTTTKQNKTKQKNCEKQTKSIDASATRKNLGVRYRSRAWKSIVLFFLQKNKKIQRDAYIGRRGYFSEVSGGGGGKLISSSFRYLRLGALSKK